MSLQQLSALWESIEQSGMLGPSAIRFLDSGVRFPTGPVLIGVDGVNQRHLCIPAPVGELGRADRRSRGVTVEVRSLMSPEGRETPFVDVHCRRPDLNALFEIVARDILAESQRQPESPFATAHAVLERWRELLEPAESAPLGPKQLAALLAELLLLERLGSGSAPVNYWMGPEKGPHDFICGIADFEVKSSLSTTRREVEVHGLSQLTASPGTVLHLWWVRLRAAPGRGSNVPDTVARILARGGDAALLMKKLKSEGYLQKDADAYRDISFEVLETCLYEVDSHFPHLTSASFSGGLPAQITRVAYTVNLDAAEPVPLSEASAQLIFASVK